MSVRSISYIDYGITEEELKKILKKVRSDSKEREIYREYCRQTKPELLDDIYYSTIANLSWENLQMFGRANISKNDFYGYRRKSIIAYFYKQKKDAHQLLDGQMHFDDLKEFKND